MDFAIIRVKTRPDAPTKHPATIKAVFNKRTPAKAAATPDNEFSNEMTTGISPPPIGTTKANPANNEATKNAMKDDAEVDESGILYRAGVKKYGKAGMKAIQSAAGKGASHQEIGKIKDKHLKDDEAMEEGLKDWAKKTAMAGVIVAGLAGIGSISDAIDNSIPAISAMETALEMAEKSGNDELAKMIEKDLSDAKIRLSSGKDLSHVTDLQNKYAKFIKTEGLAYESKLAVSLNQRLK